MKATKKITQRNTPLNKDYYTEAQIEEMFKKHEVFSLRTALGEEEEDNEPRVGINPGDKVEVVDNGYGCYTVVVIKGNEQKLVKDEFGEWKVVEIKGGKRYFVKLDF